MSLAEELLTKSLGEYQNKGFRLYEQDDHTLVLEHMLCGFKDRFMTTAGKNQIDAIKNDCGDHLKRCEFTTTNNEEN